MSTCIHGLTYSHEYTVQCCGTFKIKCMSCIKYTPVDTDNMIFCYKCKGIGWYLQKCPHDDECKQPMTMYCSGRP